MAGNILWKESSLITLSSSQSSLATGTAVAAATTLDCRAAGTSGAIETFVAQLVLTCQWSTVTGIANGTDIADIYLVPAVDGTNYPDVDTTSGASHISPLLYAGSFICAKAPSASTNMVFVSAEIDLLPLLYKVYILNQSGQTMAASWTLTLVAASGQYT